MANRTYLCGLNQNFFEDDDDQIQLNVLLEARYALPLLWFTLFQPDDIKLYSNVPILLTSRAAALANLDRSAPALAAFVGQPATAIVAHWRTFIEQNEYENYLVNTHELQMMEDTEGEFHHDLQQMMAEFGSIVDGTAPTRELYVVGQADRSLAEYPYRGIALHLCGVSFNCPMPWEGRKQA